MTCTLPEKASDTSGPRDEPGKPAGADFRWRWRPVGISGTPGKKLSEDGLAGACVLPDGQSLPPGGGETPEPNLVAGMKWLLGVYTQRYNHRHGGGGTSLRRAV